MTITGDFTDVIASYVLGGEGDKLTRVILRVNPMFFMGDDVPINLCVTAHPKGESKALCTEVPPQFVTVDLIEAILSVLAPDQPVNVEPLLCDLPRNYGRVMEPNMTFLTKSDNKIRAFGTNSNKRGPALLVYTKEGNFDVRRLFWKDDLSIDHAYGIVSTVLGTSVTNIKHKGSFR